MSATQPPGEPPPPDLFTEMLRLQGEAARQVLESFAPAAAAALPGRESLDAMGAALRELQQRWLGAAFGAAPPAAPMADWTTWLEAMQRLVSAMPVLDARAQQQLLADSAALTQQVLGAYAAPAAGAGEQASAPPLPFADPRFAAPAWREQPAFALMHQIYLLFARRIAAAIDSAEGPAAALTEDERARLRFATRALLDAMSPANFPMLNPVVLERTVETGGQNLATGMERLWADLARGQLTHTDASRFRLGENVAATPGKVIFETPLFQLIHYAPVTPRVQATPLVIFPPWINRFYILDLNPRKSFVRWALEQGLSVFMVSWRSADASLAEVGVDDYVRAQMTAMEVVRTRLKVPSVHALGYCVAGTTLAMTLAVLARRGALGGVKSATFLTAQVDFSRAGDLGLFVDDNHLAFIREASRGGYFDGRYMAATFNMLRGSDLVWNYVVNHYLLGEDYPAFDLLYWNGDVTNLPARWHEQYLRDCYRDNLLVQPDALSADGTPVDLRRIDIPAYVQAGREDHIAPPDSVFRLCGQLGGPTRFVLAGSGHIAGVVNPPEARKYQYWTADSGAPDYEAFCQSAQEHPGSWWPDWGDWLRSIDPREVAARGARRPGGRANPAIEDAPGRYVTMR